MKKTIKEQKSILIILLSNIFIAFLGIGLIIPVMPSFMNIMHLSGKTMGGILFDVNVHYPYLFAAVIMIIGLGITVVWKEKQLAENLVG